MNLTELKILTCTYGSFRHWGHPFIDYMEGLKALHKNVTNKLKPDIVYANQLASDLAYKILREKFEKDTKWYVKKHILRQDDPMHDHILHNTWPTASEI